MRKRLILTVALAGALTVAVAGIAVADQPVELQLGNLVLVANGGVKPTTLPKKTMAPITLTISGDVKTKDGSHPPALSEGVINFDKNGMVNAKGLPVCKKGQIEARDTAAAKKACPNALVGTGHTTVEVEFPEQRPFQATGPLLLFNGGTKGNTTTMYIQAYVAVPTPTALVTTVQISKIHKGAYGTRSAFKVPTIAGGSGSVTHFDLTIHRTFTYRGHKESYLSAKCPSGHFQAEIEKAVFGSTVLSGEIVRSCKGR